MKTGYLVSWRDMMKDSDEPLPMRTFDSKLSAEAYIMGCADVLCVTSNNDLKVEEVIKDFIITQMQ